jgi:hypothetical protein
MIELQKTFFIKTFRLIFKLRKKLQAIKRRQKQKNDTLTTPKKVFNNFVALKMSTIKK